jgi:hypothetical protein
MANNNLRGPFRLKSYLSGELVLLLALEVMAATGKVETVELTATDWLSLRSHFEGAIMVAVRRGALELGLP